MFLATLKLHTQGLPTHGMMAACLRDILIYSLPHTSLPVSHPNMQPPDHMYNGVQIQTLLLPAVASLVKEKSLYLISLSSGRSRIQLSIPDLRFIGAPKSCLTTGFVNTCNRDRSIIIATGLRFGFKIKSHKFLWEHLKKLLQNKD